MSKKNFKKLILTASSVAAILTLAACGGGDGSGGSSATSTATPTAPSTVVAGTLATPQYPTTSAQLAMFTLLNQQRQQCGFPALQENTVLDTAAEAHATYMGLMDATSDTEVAGSPGFTGVTYLNRAVAAGFPSTATGSGGSGGVSTETSSFSAATAGLEEMNAFLSGVYHVAVVMFPVTTVGIGESETQTAASSIPFTNSWASISLLDTQTQPLTSPLTYPCQGSTDVAYKGIAESPTAPNVSASGWGTPVVVMGNFSSDTIVLQTGTMTDPSGAVINLQLLDSANDPNQEIKPYYAVAYPASPLAPNTTYTVSITGTDNGKAMTPISFSFTTGNVIG